MTSIIHSRAEEKNLNFLLEQQQNLPQGIEADETRLHQVLLNLLDNAIKFTETGQVTLKVSLLGIDPAQDDDRRQISLRFEIQDTGLGIKPEQLQTIFKPYEQVAQGIQKSEGTGLGLAITQQLVKLMGGDLQVDSRPGQGSCFWFETSFPEVESLRVESKADQTLINGYEGERRKVLIVDDRLENQWMLQSMLEPLGFALQTAENGQEAVQQTQQFKPDLILMDLMMPIMDGFAATQAIRAAADLTQPRIVVVSAEAFQAERQKAKAVGSDDYLVKPINESLLIRALQEQLTLEWIYEDLPTGAEPEQAWLLPPPSELQVVYDIALDGDMNDIHTQADHLLSLDPQYKPFADKLHTLANGFDDEAIMALLESYLQ
ncbi:MAG: response regulator [Gammaproteobacteria bacterium]|nr:response regulator [Gammaproteobacteria bacterium]